MLNIFHKTLKNDQHRLLEEQSPPRRPVMLQETTFDSYDNLPIILPRQRELDNLSITTVDQEHTPSTQATDSPNVFDDSNADDDLDDPFGSDSTFFALRAKLHTGETFPFALLKGKFVIVVNIASQCSLASQLHGLQEIYERFPEVEILGFPSNDFLQERRSLGMAVECYADTGVKFRIMEMVSVNGKNSHTVFQWLKKQKRGVMGVRRISWNYEKFLVDREGRVIKRYNSYVQPSKISEDLEELFTQERERGVAEAFEVNSDVMVKEGRKIVYV